MGFSMEFGIKPLPTNLGKAYASLCFARYVTLLDHQLSLCFGKPITTRPEWREIRESVSRMQSKLVGM
jgi:hypothetical protein